MHVGSGVLMFSVAIVGVRLRSLAPFVDSIDSFGSKAIAWRLSAIGYVSSACFKHLGCCGLEVKSKQFLDQFTVC